jgi:penicillin V acylase-like amidase (Ntn superfamily)
MYHNMRAEVIGTQPMGNNAGTATYYRLYTDDGQVVKYHCTTYNTGDKHLSGDGSARAKGVRAGTYNGGIYEFNVKPQFVEEVRFMMNVCDIPMQGGKKKSRRNRKSRLRTRKASHKKLTLRSSN